MQREEISAAVRDIFRDVFDDDALEISDATNAEDIEDWDSLAQISLVSAIEQKFEVKFALGELAKLENIGDMLDLVQSKLGDR